LSAVPAIGDDVLNTNCPSALLFASLDGEKVAYRISEQVLKDYGSSFNSYLVGTAPLEEIIQAEQTADALDTANYDLTKNSCAHYAQQLWRNLQFKETRGLVDFIVENLLKDDGIVRYAKNTRTRRTPGAFGFCRGQLR
jgi:hypothetical protein